MARALTWVVVMLSVLLGHFICVAQANICHKFPYAQLEGYPPAQTLCSSHSANNGRMATAAPQPTNCRTGDSLCSMLSKVQKDGCEVVSALCSCIDHPPSCHTKTVTITSTASVRISTITATRHCSAIPVTVTVTSPARTATITATIFHTRVQTITKTATSITTAPPSTTTIISTATTTSTTTTESTATTTSTTTTTTTTQSTATTTTTDKTDTTTTTTTVTTTTTHVPTCTPNPAPPNGANCPFLGLDAGAGVFAISAVGNTAPSTSNCAQQCILLTQCQSFEFDGTNCVLYSQSSSQLEIEGFIFPVDPGVAGSTDFYDRSCYICG